MAAQNKSDLLALLDARLPIDRQDAEEYVKVQDMRKLIVDIFDSYANQFNGFTIEAQSGEGIKVGTVETPAYGWRDITGAIDTRGVGATDPAWTQMGSSTIYAYAFALNDVCWFTFHMPHDYVPGTDIHFHTHWTSDGTDTNTVKWQYDYAYAQGFDQAAYPIASVPTVTSEQAGSGTAWQAMVSETAGVTIANLETDGLILARIARITNGGVDNTDTIFVSTIDIHYQSTNLATPGKAPDFYTP